MRDLIDLVEDVPFDTRREENFDVTDLLSTAQQLYHGLQALPRDPSNAAKLDAAMHTVLMYLTDLSGHIDRNLRPRPAQSVSSWLYR